jgi:hypothetical protein
MIDKITVELNQKLELANDKEFFSSVMPSGTGETNFKNKLRVNLSKNDLAVLIWWLAESKILEFDGSRTLLVKFIEANLMYLDKSRDMHFDAKYIQTVMSKLTDPTSPEVDLQQSRQNLLDKLISTELPPTTYVIKTMKPKD